MGLLLFTDEQHALLLFEFKLAGPDLEPCDVSELNVESVYVVFLEHLKSVGFSLD